MFHHDAFVITDPIISASIDFAELGYSYIRSSIVDKTPHYYYKVLFDLQFLTYNSTYRIVNVLRNYSDHEKNESSRQRIYTF